MRYIAVLLLLFAWLADWPVQAREFRSSDIQPPDHPAVQAVAYMGKLIRERTRGRLTIGIHGANDRDSESFTVAEVRTGRLDMARVNLAPLGDIAPASVVPALPYLFASQAHLRRVLDGPAGAEILATLEPHGLVGLCFYDSGARSFYSSRKPIRTAADMKGMVVRIQPSPLWRAIVRALGAKAMPMPYGQVHAAFDLGAVDASENNWLSYASSGHHEVAKFYSLTEHSREPGVVVLSKRVWDGLSQEDQAIVRAAARESVPYFRKLWDEREAATRQALTAKGVEIVTDVDSRSFVDALAPVYARFAADPALRERINRIQAGAD